MEIASGNPCKRSLDCAEDGMRSGIVLERGIDGARQERQGLKMLVATGGKAADRINNAGLLLDRCPRPVAVTFRAGSRSMAPFCLPACTRNAARLDLGMMYWYTSCPPLWAFGRVVHGSQHGGSITRLVVREANRLWNEARHTKGAHDRPVTR